MSTPAGYRQPAEGVHPPYDYADYRSTHFRHPKQPLVILPHTLSEITGPIYGHDRIKESDNDLTRQYPGEPQGQRIIVSGRVLDEDARPVPNALVEIWQANAAGRYKHARDNHPAPLDPNFAGAGRTLTDKDGRYRFTTIRPGSYPWENHYNAWRPAHIHFSLFGPSFATRLVTQMYFEGDPLFSLDPVMMSVPDARARQRLVANFDINTTIDNWAHGYVWDIVLRGRDATPTEDHHHD
jgi:protocatechuate 3,4-dioxygenase beta subunit